MGKLEPVRWVAAAVALLFLLFVVALFALKIPPISGAANDPGLCGRCHVMDQIIQSFQVSAHRDVNCNECHTAHGFFSGPITKMGLGAKHVSFFLAGAEAAGVEGEAVEEARALQREARWYFDWVSAENGMGFHNPQKAMSTLGRSIDLAHQARLKAEVWRVLRVLDLLAGA